VGRGARERREYGFDHGAVERTLRTGFIRYEEHRRHAPMPKALWYVGPGIAELREEAVAPGPDDVLVRAQFGAISRGTEALIFAGRVPASEYQRMRAPHMGGTFPFPVKYGYAVVGRVESGVSDLRGRMVFALHPHQDVFALPASAVASL